MRWLWIILAFGLAGGAGAQPVDVANVQARVAAALNAGDADAARAVLVEIGANDVDRVFLDGLILERAGDLRGAETLYRAVLDARPDLSPIRERLVRVLIAQENWNGAAFQIEALISRSKSPAERRALDRLRRQTLARRRAGVSLSGGVLPTSNINRATSNTTSPFIDGLVAEIDETRESGVGLSAVLSGFRRVPLSGERLLQFDLSASATLFDRSEFNRGALVGGVSLSWPAGNGGWRAGLQHGEFFQADDEDQAGRTTLSLRRTWRSGDGTEFALSGSVSRTDFREPVNAQFDARGVDLDLSVGRRLSDRRVARASIGLGHSDVENDRFTYDRVSLGVSLSQSWANGITLTAGPRGELRNYDLPFGPPFNVARRDRTLGLGVSVQDSDLRIGSGVPRLDCTLSRTSSNIALYDNRDVVECALSLTRAF